MRPDWDEYFMTIAKAAATRGTCDRKQVGCVLVRDRAILATGYNGAIRGMEHCDDVGHLMAGQKCKNCHKLLDGEEAGKPCPKVFGDHAPEGGNCIRTVHAEANAIAQAAKHGMPVDEATAYVTAAPCWICFRQVVNAGVKRIVFSEAYRLDPKVVEAAKITRVELVDLSAV